MNSNELVLRLLYEKPMTAAELAQEAKVMESTVAHALNRLRKAGVNIKLLRSKKYKLIDPQPDVFEKLKSIPTRDRSYLYGEFRETEYGYSIPELKEIWERVKNQEFPYRVLSQFALCSEKSARKLVEEW